MYQADQLARRFHDLYEELAPTFGYETRSESAVPWEKVPENNRQLMVAVCSALLSEGLVGSSSILPALPAKHGPDAL